MEKVGALEMAVALRVLSVDGAGVDGNFKSGSSVVRFEAVQYALIPLTCLLRSRSSCA